MVGFVSVGVAITILFEWLATNILDRWVYADSMPTLPILGTGSIPLVQWIIIPPLVLWFVRRQLTWYQVVSDSDGRYPTLCSDRRRKLLANRECPVRAKFYLSFRMSECPLRVLYRLSSAVVHATNRFVIVRRLSDPKLPLQSLRRIAQLIVYFSVLSWHYSQ